MSAWFSAWRKKYSVLNNWQQPAIASAVLLTFALMAVGYIVRANGGSQACPDWPTCFGQWGMPGGVSAQLQVAHRWLAAGASVAALTTAVVFLRTGAPKLAVSSAMAALAALIAQIGIGALHVFSGPGTALAISHLGLSLLALAALLLAWLGLEPRASARVRWDSPFTRLALATTFLLLILSLNGALVSSVAAGPACEGWPLCAGGMPSTAGGWLSFGHRMLTALASVFVLLQLRSAWRSQRTQSVVLTAATAAAVLFAGLAFIGARKVSLGFPMDLVTLHSVSAVGLWGAQALVLFSAALAGRSAAEEREEGQIPHAPLLQRARDFLVLSKPIIVLLLLVTTYAGMVVGGKQIPGFWLTVWTMLGGALAAGGASALNQYIDRNIDGRMQRTAKRPLPDGRLLPAEALAYGVAACLTAFFLLAGMVNLISALLSLAGMVYYIVIYSLWLKHATVQNIVIGGGAGAIPPLVGWAAATGSLNVPSLFLFALVFLWTPPHFWALALVRQKDYARAGVPMLPVVRGEMETRRQVFIYTLELVALTLLMPLFKVAGSVFLISALLLGLWLISAAWNVLRKPGNKVAWRMYRYSSMYLAFIYLALVLDVLL